MLAAAHVDDPKPAATPNPEPAPAEKPAREVPGFEAPPIPDGLPIIFDQYHIDLGGVDDAGGEVTVGFRFTNTSDKPVKVELLNYGPPKRHAGDPAPRSSRRASPRSDCRHGRARARTARSAWSPSSRATLTKPVSLFCFWRRLSLGPGFFARPIGLVRQGRNDGPEKVKLIIAALASRSAMSHRQHAFTLTTEDEKKVLVNGVERTETLVVVSLPGLLRDVTRRTSRSRLRPAARSPTPTSSLRSCPARCRAGGRRTRRDLAGRPGEAAVQHPQPPGDTVRIDISLAYGQSQSDPRLPGFCGVRPEREHADPGRGHIVHAELFLSRPTCPGSTADVVHRGRRATIWSC